MIVYKHIKDFDEKHIEELFKSVNWISGNFPYVLKQALKYSTRVISAWDGEKLVGLIRGMDDGVWQATIDCLLVDPQYQRRGIASALLNSLLEEYRDYFYVNVTPDEKENVAFYQKYGFEILQSGTPLQIKGNALK